MKNFETKLFLAFGIFMIINTSIDIYKHRPKKEDKELINLINTLDAIPSTKNVSAVINDGDKALVRIAILPWSGSNEVLFNNRK